jgi:outer membrane lipoprotein-sorting protein
MLSLFNFAAAASKPQLKAVIDLKPLNDATARYRAAKVVKSELIKLVKYELTGKEVKNEGEVAISEGLFRLENKSPEKSLIVYDGNILWNEQKPSDDFGGPTQVTKSVIGKKNKSQTFFATMLSKEPVTKYFKRRKSYFDKRHDPGTAWRCQAEKTEESIIAG